MQRNLTYEAMKALVTNKLKGQLKRTHIIDVRELEEVKKTGIIPVAINIPLGQLELALKSNQEYFLQNFSAPKPLQNDTLVIYCKMGGRAEKGVKLAQECGYKETKVFPGGWDEWSKYSNNNNDK